MLEVQGRLLRIQRATAGAGRSAQGRAFQLAQLKVTLPWAARELGLPAPDLLSEVH